MTTVSITIPGKPVPWMRAGDNLGQRFTDPKAAENKRAIAWEAKKAYGLRRPALGPVVIRVVSVFAIPPSWPPKLQAAAREARVMHDSDPDADRLLNQVLDSLKGIAYLDDNQVCAFSSCAKRYGYPERTEITIQELPRAADEKTPAQRRREARVAKEGWDRVLAPPPKRAKTPKVDSDTAGDAALLAAVRAGKAAPRKGRVWRGRRAK